MTVDQAGSPAEDLVPREIAWLLCPPRDFDVQVLTAAPGVAVVVLTGAVDTRSATVFRDAVASATAGGARAVVVDLRAATRLDAAGLGVIVMAARRLGTGAVSVVVTHAGLARTLRSCGLDRLLGVHQTRDEAVRAAGAATPPDPRPTVTVW
jgi:stage II sporulation protein AA (anti-sigma F factor antagonist)